MRSVRVQRVIAAGPAAVRATVQTHLSAILTKPGLRDRVQAAMLAYEVGLVRPGTDPRTRPQPGPFTVPVRSGT